MTSRSHCLRTRTTVLAVLVGVGPVAWLGSNAVSELTSTPAAVAQDTQEKAQEAKEARISARAELEKDFAELLSNATFVGKWRLVRDGKIGEERSEKYTLGSVRKLDGDKWVIEARIEYGEKDFKVPVRVDVKWAGDTPVIQVTDWGVPALGVGPYTARVMVYKGMYTGTWFGKNFGGLMSGEIIPAKKAKSGDEK